MTDRDQAASIVSEGEALTELGNLLYTLLTPGGVELVLDVRGATAMTSEFTVVVAHGDGSETYPEYGYEVPRAFRNLRVAMYRPGVGTWLSARFVVTAHGTMDVEYNYDDEPRLDIDVVPGTYAHDLDRFPRDPEHIPGWLQRKLEEAAAEDS